MTNQDCYHLNTFIDGNTVVCKDCETELGTAFEPGSKEANAALFDAIFGDSSAPMYSVFNRAGFNVESQLFDTLEEATKHASITHYEDNNGFYPVHAGMNCPRHDERESNNCPRCGTKTPINESLEFCPSLREILAPVEPSASAAALNEKIRATAKRVDAASIRRCGDCRKPIPSNNPSAWCNACIARHNNMSTSKSTSVGQEARHLCAIAECVKDATQRYYFPGGSAADLQSALNHLDSLRYQLTNTRRAIKAQLKQGHNL